MDNLTPEQRRKNMQRIRSKDTKPERIIAKELRKRKIYCTRNDKRIYGKPDFVFRRKKVVVFVDSDYWHGHPERCIMPKTNIDYWKPKIERNINRDKEVDSKLKADGWNVVRIWEFDVKKNIECSIKKILGAIDKEF
ncbi:very short patch repair endonuclease [candidate division KSB1 bacterium]